MSHFFNFQSSGVKLSLVLASLAINLIFGSGCAHMDPTPYSDKNDQRFGKSFGSVPETSFEAAEFSGNNHTDPKLAFHYSKMAAIERCFSQGQLASPLHTFDQTQTLTYTQVNATTHTLPALSSRGRGFTTTSVYSYPVTLRYPRFRTAFRCASYIHQLESKPELEEISAELVHPYTQDFRGGLLVKETSGKGQIRVGDVITAVEGQRVEDYLDFFPLVHFSDQPRSTYRLKVVRDGKLIEMDELTKDLSPATLLNNAQEVSYGCERRRQLRSQGKIPYQDTIPALCELKASDWRERFPYIQVP